MPGKQLFVLGGGAPAVVAVLLLYQHADELFAQVTLPADDAASRLAYVAGAYIVGRNHRSGPARFYRECD